jgi:hypothetical protein
MAHKQAEEKGRKGFFNFAGGSRRLLITVCVGLVVLVAGAVVLLGPEAGGSSQAAAGAPDVTYAAKTFQDGKARFYEYKTGDGITVKYFIVKSSDGVIRAAFDACDVCWPAGKGYSQKGDFMVCRNCGRQFASVRVNEVTGGCNPGALRREMAGDKLVIKGKDIVEGRKYFDFAKRG